MLKKSTQNGSTQSFTISGNFVLTTALLGWLIQTLWRTIIYKIVLPV
jgi:hypothetical protein